MAESRELVVAHEPGGGELSKFNIGELDDAERLVRDDTKHHLSLSIDDGVLERRRTQSDVTEETRRARKCARRREGYERLRDQPGRKGRRRREAKPQ